jgi:hypothetical protein
MANQAPNLDSGLLRLSQLKYVHHDSETQLNLHDSFFTGWTSTNESCVQTGGKAKLGGDSRLGEHLELNNLSRK